MWQLIITDRLDERKVYEIYTFDELKEAIQHKKNIQSYLHPIFDISHLVWEEPMDN